MKVATLKRDKRDSEIKIVTRDKDEHYIMRKDQFTRKIS